MYHQSVTYALGYFLTMTGIAGFLAVFLVARNSGRCAMNERLMAVHGRFVNKILDTTQSALNSILGTRETIHEAMAKVVSGVEKSQRNNERPRSQYDYVVKELTDAVWVFDVTTESMHDLINTFVQSNIGDVINSELVLEPRVFNCIAAATAIFAQHRIIKHDGLEMTMTNQVGPCVVNLDLVRFRQVLANGFGNACKVTCNGRVDFRICWASPGREAIEFIIEDTGPGLMGVDPEKLFEEFERGAQAKSVKAETASTGLGLTISRKIAVAFGGSLHLEDRGAMEGVQGARFVFRLPASVIVGRTAGEVCDAGDTSTRKAAALGLTDDEVKCDGEYSRSSNVAVVPTRRRVVIDGAL
jgi:signal transduction histidine kinase